MNQATLFNAIAKYVQERISVGKADTKRILVAIMDGVEEELLAGHRVKFGHLFTVIPSKESVRKRYDMNTAKVVTMGGGRTLKLRVHKGFKQSYRTGKATAGPLRLAPPKADKVSKECTPEKDKKKASSKK